MGLTYDEAGVDIEAGEKVVDKIKDEVESTHGPEVLTGLGSFGAVFAPDLSEYDNPVMVSGTDGVGTKLKVAFRANKHDTIGIDLVAMCVNDILAQGANPLFFLDYLASGKLDPAQMSEVVTGIASGCRKAECALIGGETAEMPGFYQKGEYDMAGFAVGLVEKERVITGNSIAPGDKIIGLASNGLHSNGFSLVRKILFEKEGYSLEDDITISDFELPSQKQKDNLTSLNLKNELLKPTRIYVKSVLKLIEEFPIKGLAHITGGGITENLSRILQDDLQAELKTDNWHIPNIFQVIRELGGVQIEEMYQTFNMGIGMAVIIDQAKVKEAVNLAEELGEKASIIGQVKEKTDDESDKVIYK